jgi:hypothetical protein
MAIPQGNFTNGGAGITSPGGAIAYEAGVDFPQYFAGTFYIDTGYDDPVLWTTGVDAADVYGARVYIITSTHSPAQAAGTYIGSWNVVATPMWKAKHWALPHSNTPTQARVFIKCDCYVSEPVDKGAGAFQRAETDNWSLYRI